MVEKILLFGEITPETSKEVIENLLEYDSPRYYTPIELVINSLGGHTDFALPIINTIKNMKRVVNTTGIGEVSSCALYVLAAGKYRKIGRNTFCIAHQTSLDSFSGYSSDLEIQQKFLKQINDSYFQYMLGVSNGKCSGKVFQQKDELITPDVLLEMNLVDEIFDEFKKENKNER